MGHLKTVIIKEGNFYLSENVAEPIELQQIIKLVVFKNTVRNLPDEKQIDENAPESADACVIGDYIAVSTESDGKTPRDVCYPVLYVKV